MIYPVNSAELLFAILYLHYHILTLDFRHLQSRIRHGYCVLNLTCNSKRCTKVGVYEIVYIEIKKI